jgi:hypothetical protein
VARRFAGGATASSSAITRAWAGVGTNRRRDSPRSIGAAAVAMYPVSADQTPNTSLLKLQLAFRTSRVRNASSTSLAVSQHSAFPLEAAVGLPGWPVRSGGGGVGLRLPPPERSAPGALGASRWPGSRLRLAVGWGRRPSRGGR